ncbi:MAG: glycoside hydrolase family protein [Polyangiaceae bacterium]|nr:glycoside hydrolase family protein [Polyangiaceae bacterium]
MRAKAWLFGGILTVVTGCGDPNGDADEDGNPGGTSGTGGTRGAGGARTGGAGPVGGASSGGVATAGGRATGGARTGGAGPVGGASSGGTGATGSQTAGEQATGGRATGGTASAGGTSPGGDDAGGAGAGATTTGSGTDDGGGSGTPPSGSGAAIAGAGGIATGGRAADGGAGGSAGGSRQGCKRGVAYGYHSAADLAALSTGVSWWYNWDFRPDSALRDGAYRSYDVEYAPMIWGAGTDRNATRTAIPEDATTLLGFNEPNFGSQADLSATEAAALWPELEAIADARGLRLVSPAVNFCGGDCHDTDPFHYLDEFFAACNACRVDAIAIHVYVGCNPNGNNHAEWLIGHVETYKSRFSQPLWLTEFACDNATNEAEQQAFLEDAVAYLEAEPRIARYAWFAGRADNMSHVDLLGDDGQLTALGTTYVNAPQAEGCQR